MIRRKFLLLSVLALTACRSTPIVPSPAPLSLYELELNPVDGQSTQVIQAGGLRFTLLNSSTLVESDKRVLHLSATYKVTNLSPAPLQRPTYLPVVTAGAYATLGDTPFRKVLSRKGLAVVPSGVQTETAHRLRGTTVIVDPEATPLIGPLNNSNRKLAVPDNSSVVSINDQGWQAPPLASGASQQITFAVKIPLGKQDIGDNDPFRLNLVLTVAD